VAIFGGFVLISSIAGTRPPAVTWFAEKGMNIWTGAGIFIIPIVIFFIGGLIIGRVTTPNMSRR
jgi:hypothetical protein